MNNSNAAAKRRRAGIQPTTPPMPPTATSQPSNGGSGGAPGPQSGLTLPQVISLIDNRLITLETFMKETKESTDLTIPNIPGETSSSAEDGGAVFMDSKEFTDFVEDVNQRFQLFADEINGLKEIVLKLQGFTMDVNKMLLGTLAKNGEAVTIPNITFEGETDSTITPETATPTTDDVDKAVVTALAATSGKNKKK